MECWLSIFALHSRRRRHHARLRNWYKLLRGRHACCEKLSTMCGLSYSEKGKCVGVAIWKDSGCLGIWEYTYGWNLIILWWQVYYLRELTEYWPIFSQYFQKRQSNWGQWRLVVHGQQKLMQRFGYQLRALRSIVPVERTTIINEECPIDTSSVSISLVLSCSRLPYPPHSPSTEYSNRNGSPRTLFRIIDIFYPSLFLLAV